MDGSAQNFDDNNGPGTVVVRCSGVSLTFRTFAFGGLCAVQIAIQLARFSSGVFPVITPFV